MAELTSWLPILASAIAIFGVYYTYVLTKRREHEAEWRKIKLDHYRELLAAMSGIVRGRSTQEARLRFTDAVNAMMLIAPGPVYRALREFAEHSATRTAEQEDRLRNILVKAMRVDIDPKQDSGNDDLTFGLLAPPPTDEVIGRTTAQHGSRESNIV